MMFARQNIRPASSRQTTTADSVRTRLSRRICPSWIARLTFILCGAMVLLMAIHGDEHGHRPRFVWQSLEDTQKLAALETPDRAARPSLGAVPPSSILHFVSVAPLAATRAPFSAPAIAPRQPARAVAYLLPFANGPPARS